VKIFNNENKGSTASNVQQIHLELMQSQKKAAEAKERSNKTLAKINELKQKLGDKKPQESNMVQNKDDRTVINIEALSKPDSANKIQELEAMESALAKAAEEAHKQRLTILSTGSLNQVNMSAQSQAVQSLRQKQDAQQKALLDKLEAEEKQRQDELKKNIDLEKKIEQAEKERQEEEQLTKRRQEELKRLQAEEAAQKAEAEQKEQEFLAAQAIQETKQAAARRAAAKANLARLKRRNELQRTQAEAQLKLLRIKHQNELDAMLEVEKARTELPIAAPVQMQSTAQMEAKKQLEQFEKEQKEAVE